ncbi:endogenous inhibitor of DNA gyrase (YacG/DUF329 family) [Gellertiella hungarica]|uniref:Endogenous inhibitor of DNA gyrase (YacG/DUF329 family) n=1 Tax=Gellertiella hungarica TaxID=1572859 RepID=A0A7W6NKC6_9HYPH|nr:endogenous inhibitor of DNA gyrase (YacG/DUF329 family) [Gellertiella hungarica]
MLQIVCTEGGISGEKIPFPGALLKQAGRISVANTRLKAEGTPLKALTRKMGDELFRRHVKEASIILGAGTFSKFEHEGACRSGLRSALCSDGWGWSDADIIAAGITAAALKAIGAVRPTWQEGQPEYALDGIKVVERVFCKGCGVKIPEQDSERPRDYCEPRCVQAHHGRMAAIFGRQRTRMELIAAWVAKRENFSPSESTCERCGKMFPVKNSYRERKYCSSEYRSAVMKNPRKPIAPIPCPQCQVSFLPKTKAVKFCSRTCVAQSYVAAARRAPKECRHCSKTFQPSVKDESFCSRDCRFRANRKSMVDKPCLSCGAIFTARSEAYKFCSKPCYHDHKASQKAVISCPTCKTQFRRGVKSGRKTYCSDRCRPIGKISASNLRCSEVRS